MSRWDKQARTTLYALAEEAFGREAQINKAIQELSELSCALYEYEYEKLQAPPSQRMAALSEEVADVSIMLEQLDLFYDVPTLSYKQINWHETPKQMYHCANLIKLLSQDAEGKVDKGQVAEAIMEMRADIYPLMTECGPEEVWEIKSTKLDRLQRKIVETRRGQGDGSN